MEKVLKKETLLQAKKLVEQILDKEKDPLLFMNSKLYLVNKKTADNIIAIDKELLFPLRSKKTKRQPYSINKIVNLINPNYEAYWYGLTVAKKKSSQVKDQDKCKDRILQQKRISENFHKKRTKDFIDTLPSSKEKKMLIEKAKFELKEKIKEEDDNLRFILKNIDNLEFIITNHRTAKDYGQVNYKYTENEIRKSSNSHLSIVYPNLLVYKDRDLSIKRTDMEIEDFLKKAKLAFGNFYYKKKD